jgi:hypothetical protein
MKQIEVDIPMEMYFALIDKFGTQRKVEDILTMRLDQSIRKEKSLMRKRILKPVMTKTITVYLKDYMYPFFMDLLIHRTKTKKELILKMCKRLIKE